MAEYIDRKKAIETVKFYDGENDPIPWAVRSLKVIPAADVRPVVRGKWLEENPDYLDGDTMYVCSICGETWTLIAGSPEENNMNFCPNCGADLRKEAGDA